MTQRLSDRVVKALSVPASGSKITYDSEVSGFGARVTAAGARAFVLNYRIGGRERRYTIGSFPDWSVTAAREEARTLKRRIDRGEDPMGERHEERAAPTVGDMCDRYITDHLPKKRPTSQRDDLAMINTIICPRLGREKVADVRFGEVERLHRDISQRAPIRANRVASLLRRLFNLSIRWGWRADNPCQGIERNHEECRSRYLTGDELARLSGALAEHSHQVSANAVRLVILTGARRGEVLAAEWSQFDLAAGVWTKPSSHTKQRREHRVPLSAPALQLLTAIKEQQVSEVEQIRRKCGKAAPLRYLFHGVDPEKRLTDVKRTWATVCRRAGLTGVHLHDLRHTFASIVASGGGSLPLIGALLGHAHPSTTARYSHLFDDPLRAATERVGAVFVAASAPEQAEVVPLQRSGQAGT